MHLFIRHHAATLTTVTTQVQCALTHMEGAAASFKDKYLREIADGQNPFATWNDFEQVFKQSFEIIRELESAELEIDQCTQGK